MQAGGILFIYKTQQFFVQQEMRQTLNSNKTQFQKITLSLSDYQKNKINAHEISIKGKMYDVKSTHISGDSLELLVVNDSKEENILEKIKEFKQETSGQNHSLHNQLKQLLSLTYLSPNTDGIFIISSLSMHLFPHPNLNTISSHIAISTPPPEFV